MARSNPGKPWTDEHKAFVVANRATMTNAEIGAALGRSGAAVSSWCNQNRIAANIMADPNAYIRRNWSSMTTKAIASVVCLSDQAVRDRARSMGLAPKPCSAGAVPSRLKGFTPEQVLWARAHRGDREADLILGMLDDPAARRTVA